VKIKIVRFCKLSIDKWNTSLHLKQRRKQFSRNPSKQDEEYSRGTLFRHYSSVQKLLRIFQGHSLSPLLFCTALIANSPGGHTFAIILYNTYCEYSRGTLFRHYSSVKHLLRIFQGEYFSPLFFCTALNAKTQGRLSFTFILLYSTKCGNSRGTLFRHYSSVKHLLRIFQGEYFTLLFFCTALNAKTQGRLSFAFILLYGTYCEYSMGTLFRHYSSVEHLLRILQWDSISPLLFCTALIANIPGGLYFAITLLYSTYCIKTRA